jgi:uncharacterized protein (TIGR02996 family)
VGPSIEEEFVRLVSEDLQDTSNILTYSDWLLERGRRRGELIALDVALERTIDPSNVAELERSRRELLDTHAEELLGAMMSKVVREGYAKIAWRRGFVDTLAYQGVGLAHRKAVGWFVATLAAESDAFRFLQSLSLRNTDLLDLQPLTRFVNLVELDIAQTSVTDFQPLERLPRLEVVHLAGCTVNQASRSRLEQHGVRLL